jgi:hypothetical protein
VLGSGLWSGQWEESRGEVTPTKNHCKFTTIVFTDYTGSYVGKSPKNAPYRSQNWDFEN